MKSFKQYVIEMNVAGAGGVFGSGASMGHGGSFNNADFYAPGDTRVPVALGARKVGKKKKPVVQRRPLVSN
ncbi:MAG: hypothetical protein EBU90_03195 [Proteobacteria bacterium]|nr:hypothetical protein [Pseudomonadota bacterium]NBP13332.1 hypothetical protein [bacterium]